MKIDLFNAFEERTCNTSISEDELIKLSATWAKWKYLEKHASPNYQVSREWLPIYEQYMGESITALSRRDGAALTEIYSNFFRHPVSTGLHGMHFDMVKNYMTKENPPSQKQIESYARFCMLNARNFYLSCPSTPVEQLYRPAVGNPYGYTLDTVEVFPNAEYHYTFAEKIRLLLRNIEKPTILELGGGYGGMAYYCLRDIANLRFISVDLPENAVLQAYYLKSQFPHKNIKLYGECPIDGDYDALIMPTYGIEELKSNSCDLAFNSYSLAEMSKEAMENYVKIICHATSQYIYHLNHAHWEISGDDFPIDLEKFSLLFRNPTNWGKDPDNYRLDQHEYLYLAI